MKWKIDESEELPLAIIEDTEMGHGVCEVENFRDKRLSMSNAMLISSAPELLIACERMLDAYAGSWKVTVRKEGFNALASSVQLAVQAIKKAKAF